MRNIIASLLAITFTLTLHAKKYALIVAVGDYDAEKTGWGKISSKNDVPLIENALILQEFKKENIFTIIDVQATKAGILNKIKEVQQLLKKGDVLVVHFSMHGQQVLDVDGDEVDGLDESIVPFDASVEYSDAYKGENHIRDDELSNIITSLRNSLGSDGQLLFLLDSCHSGSSTRGGKARGGKPALVPSGWKKGDVTINENASETAMFQKEVKSDDAASFVMISGASAAELNYEYQGNGSLSYAFAKAVSALGTDYTYRQLFSKIAAQMNIISPKQKPTIEGDLDYKLFKGEYVKQQPYYTLKRIARPDLIQINGGEIQQVFKGTTINIVPAGTTTFSEDVVVAKGEVLKTAFSTSNVQLDKALPTTNEKEYWVFIDEPAYGDMYLKAFFLNEIDPAIKEGVKSYLTKNNLGEITQKIDSATVVIKALDIANPKAGYELVNPNGLTAIDKAIASRGVTVLEKLEKQLSQYAQGSYLRDLTMNNPLYEFEFKLIPVIYDDLAEKVEEELPLEDFTDELGVFKMNTDGDTAVLEVTNHSNKDLYFTIVEINSKGEIFQFLPNDDSDCPLSANDLVIEAKESKVISVCYFQFGPPYERLTLKGFATTAPINLSPIISTRGEASTRGDANPLEKFVQETYTTTRGATTKRAGGKMRGYTTEFVYEIVEE